MRHRLLTTLLAAVLAATGPALAQPAQAGDRPSAASPQQAGAARPGGCDPLTASECLLPFPNDWYTRRDPGTETGRRVAFRGDVLPRPVLGRPVDPAPWNRSDGFSPGSTVTAHVPGLDLAATGAAPITDIGRSLDRAAPVVLIDATTGRRHPYWVEADANATSGDRQALLIHPARNFRPGHRYLVALRGMKDSAGRALPAPEPFALAAGARLPRSHPLYERQRQLRPVLHELRRAGVRTEGLHLAWDFTVASEANLTGDLYSVRDQAFGELGSRAPQFQVTGVEDFTAGDDPLIAREVTGHVTVPSYLDLPGGPPGSVFHRGRDGSPRRLPGRTQRAEFRCEIPRSAFTTPSSASLYGHGLLGSRNEVGAGNVKAMAGEHNFTFCATDWIGMAEDDIPVVVGALSDMNLFPSVPERSQQGMLGAQFLGRALIHPQGLTRDPAFRSPGGRPLLDTRQGLAYDGNSQGGILGGALVAASPDIERGVLGVTGMNYSLLLNRSADFAPFQQILDVAYPDRLRQQLVLGLYQMVWDRGETNGYASVLTGARGRPGDRTGGHSPPKSVLMHIAYGDHQVANIAADVQARTIGARLVTPALADGRSPDRVPHWGIRPARLPYQGSAMVVWDSGTPTPPLSNTPPGEPGHGADPHEDPRNMPSARQQKATFLTTGRVIDVCGGAPCTALPAP
ncbi:hypothetical protein DY218_18395 [Streptomyces triticagri]|uniref:ATP-dependent DNA helicase RecG n=1 Tax=Streptomyces triticagri TaxID=2293568 RepID=A0A372M2X2_9ACTN|nr:hypothetical protein [Streptomyces triticagri]RFU85264.1 hypothetical protein DY218_18395 [Streptomyces triticagri]